MIKSKNSDDQDRSKGDKVTDPKALFIRSDSGFFKMLFKSAKKFYILFTIVILELSENNVAVVRV